MNAHGDIWQEPELFDQVGDRPELVPTGARWCEDCDQHHFAGDVCDAHTAPAYLFTRRPCGCLVETASGRVIRTPCGLWEHRAGQKI